MLIGGSAQQKFHIRKQIVSTGHTKIVNMYIEWKKKVSLMYFRHGVNKKILSIHVSSLLYNYGTHIDTGNVPCLVYIALYEMLFFLFMNEVKVLCSFIYVNFKVIRRIMRTYMKRCHNRNSREILII